MCTHQIAGGHDVEFTPNCRYVAWPVWVGEDALRRDEELPALGEGTAADTADATNVTTKAQQQQRPATR
ncbi:hypothetical protein HaLaN_15469 [Haematococcus lacustris]|uniref:Uncharacterized protein n=1 Tax=Haematococcus lacustris TaxID=44745 RepID=A0A699Z7N6_HAELA|nr:hypothetical protein HaLaN_15469 [Haematococcus lacustris]